MKTRLLKRLKQTASALLTALVICSIFSLFVVYYLSLIEQQNSLNNRSQTWNMAMAITEAGVEEGLEHLNDNTGNLGLAPWSHIAGNVYYRTNSFADGSAYTVYITNSMPTPVVVARGYVWVGNFISLSQRLSAGFFASAGYNSGPVIVQRAVMVNCTKTSLYLAPLVAKNNINLNGNNIKTDSFDSCDPTKSINGQYVVGFYSGDGGDIASNLGLIDTISGGNANIYGKAHTGTNISGQPTIVMGPNGAVGTHAWQAANHGIQPGYALEDANFTFPDTSFPNTAGYMTSTGGVLVVSSNMTVQTPLTVLSLPIPRPSGTITTNFSSTTTATFPAAGTYLGSVTSNKSHGVIVSYTYNAIIGYTYYSNSTSVVYTTNSYDHILWGVTDINATNMYVADSLSGKTAIVGDNVVLALPNGINMGGNDSISIIPSGNVPAMGNSAPPGGAVTVYAGGSSVSINGQAIINQPGLAASFILFCAPSVSTFALTGNGGFTGVLVAPSVDLTLGGGGNNTIDFIGCAMVKSATLNGHFNFHYDQCLANLKNDPRFLVTAWNEVK